MAQQRFTLDVQAREVLEAHPIVVRGRGWPHTVQLELDGQPYQEIQPAADGDFQLHIPTFAMRPGRHVLRTAEPRLEVEMTIVPQDALGGPHRRAIDFFRRRFGRYGATPRGLRATRLEAVRALRIAWKPEVLKYTPGVGPGSTIRQALTAPCQWTPLGAGPVRAQRPRTKRSAAVMSGRVTSIAIHPKDTSTVYIGSAQGGVWKTTDGGGTWRALTDDRMTLAVSCLAIDQATPSRLYAGTDAGILFTDDDGATWDELATATFGDTTITRLLFDPADTAGRAMFLASGRGVFESPLGDDTWHSLDGAGASDLVVIPTSAGPQLIAARPSSGLWTSTRLGTGWTPWVQFVDDPSKPAFPPGNSFGRIALGQCRTEPRTVYAVFEARHSRKCAGICRTRDAGVTWEFVGPPRSRTVPGGSGPAAGHTHRFEVRKPTLDAGAATTMTTAAGSDGHRHTVGLSGDEVTALAAGRTLLKSTDADSSGHAHELVMSRAQGFQTDYNLHVAVHPTDPETIYYGEIQLWKRLGEKGGWKGIDAAHFGHHVDQHALAFDPNDAETVWIGNDGGVFRSTNGGDRWVHRNATLATLQYNRIAQHPRWETVLLAGAQDNGVQRAASHLAWDFSVGADAGFVAIDPARPTRMYHGYIENSIRRSDQAAASNSWEAKDAGLSGTPLFYPPFVLDPTDSAACFFGNTKLWRSGDHADHWQAVSRELSTSICAIAVRPANGRVVVAATTDGTVIRLQSANGTWASDDVTETDLSGAGLPAENILGLAIDSNGTVWAGVGTVMTGPAGPTNEVVYRRAEGAANWELRSTGLPAGDPVNTLVIDPAQEDRLFCGTDLGVFRTDDGGNNWTIWDQGLPNSPVCDLVIHAERRLLRAATYGRSVWERPIDVMGCPAADLYVRDNILDSGRVTPSPHGEADPFDPPDQHPLDSPILLDWSHSVDIKVDASVFGSFLSSGTAIDPLAFEDLLEAHPIRNSTNRLFVQLHNRGPASATAVKVRAFYSQSVLEPIPTLPDNFWSDGRPFDADPSGSAWVPVGSTITIDTLPPGDRVVEWDWSLPATAIKNFAVLVVTTCAEDPFTSGPLDVKDLVRGSKHVALKEMVTPFLAVVCNWATRLETYCVETAAGSYDECAEWRDDGHTACAEWKEEKTSECASWGAFSGLCTLLVEASSWVCVGWEWIKNLGCVSWTTVVVFVCVVFTKIVRFLTCW